jgi:excisionase family DNA binding protein
VDGESSGYRVVRGAPIGISRRQDVDTERQTISIMKACEVVGVSRRTIYNWMAGGKVEYVRTAGGSVRIFADSLWRAPQTASQGSEIQH